jgi:hypothetical protein
MTKAILILADLCLIPVGASNAEIWATGDILELINQANAVTSQKQECFDKVQGAHKVCPRVVRLGIPRLGESMN